MGHSCRIEICSELKSLESIAEFIRQAAEQAGLNKHENFQVQMAVDEACTNVMEYAYRDETGLIQLSCDWDTQRFVVTIEDRGNPFDPGAISTPDLTSPLEERQIGGLGLYFMHKLMDEVHFEFDESRGNRLTMSKRIHSSRPVGVAPDCTDEHD